MERLSGALRAMSSPEDRRQNQHLPIALMTGLIAAGALVGCDPAPEPPAANATSHGWPPAPDDQTASTTSPTPIALNPAAALLEVTSEHLGPEVLPPGFAYIDSVDTGNATSNVYANPEETEGPTLFLYTEIGADYTNERESVLEWLPLDGFPEAFTVSVARDADGTIVDIDASPDVAIQLIGRGLPEDEMLAAAHRLLDRASDLTR